MKHKTFPVMTNKGTLHLDTQQLAQVISHYVTDEQWAIDLIIDDISESVDNDTNFVVIATGDTLAHRYTIEDYTGDDDDHDGIIDSHGDYCLIKNI